MRHQREGLGAFQLRRAGVALLAGVVIVVLIITNTYDVAAPARGSRFPLRSSGAKLLVVDQDGQAPHDKTGSSTGTNNDNSDHNSNGSIDHSSDHDKDHHSDHDKDHHSDRDPTPTVSTGRDTVPRGHHDKPDNVALQKLSVSGSNVTHTVGLNPERCNDTGHASDQVEVRPRDPPSVIAKRAGLVRLDCRGQWGNRLGEYVVSRIVAERLGWGFEVCPILLTELRRKGHIFPNVVGFDYDAQRMAQLRAVQYKGHNYDIDAMVADTTPRVLHLNGYPFRDYEPFRRYKELIRTSWLHVDVTCLSTWHVVSPGPDDVVVHIRAYAGCGDRARGYDPSKPFVDPPVTYFDRILEHMRAQRPWNKVWITSRCGANHPEVQHIIKRFGATVAPPTEIHADTGDWLFMRAANRLVMSQSTYAWWAAFLGNAVEVHYPLVGEWWGKNPRHQLYPTDEERYVFHDLRNERYFLTGSQVEASRDRGR